MSGNVRIAEAIDDEINIWELMEHLASGWHCLVGGIVVGLVGAIGFLGLTPPKYEAKAVIQPATIGAIVATTTTTIVESVGLTLERLKRVTFYGDNLVKVCQAVSAENLMGRIKVEIVKGNDLIAVGYRADSAAVAEACIAEFVEQLAQSQATIIAPLIKELEDQRASTKRQIDDIERFLAQSGKRVALSPALNNPVFLMSKQEELMKLQKLYREQRIQLTEPLTRPWKLLAPIYAPEVAVSPKKLITVIGGLVGGLFAGVLALFVNRSWRRYKSMSV